MKAFSADYPIIQNLQNKILVPTDIQQLTDEEGVDYYEYYQASYPQSPRLSDDEYYSLANKEHAKKMQEEILQKGCPTSLGFKIDCMPNNVSDFVGTSIRISIDPSITHMKVRDYDNENHIITVAEYNQMCIELGDYVTVTREAYWADIDQIQFNFIMYKIEF